MRGFTAPFAGATTSGRPEVVRPGSPGNPASRPPSPVGADGYFGLIPNVVKTLWPLDSTVRVTLYVAELSDSDLVAKL